MNIFRIFKKNKKNTSGEKDVERVMRELEDSLKSAKEKNQKWLAEHSEIFSYRNVAISKDKAGNNKDALRMYLQSIQDCENSKYHNNEPSIAYAIERVIVLYSKEKETEKLKEYLSHIINKYPGFRDNLEWKIKLAKLENKGGLLHPNITPSDIKIKKKDNDEKTIGARISEIKKTFPEFNWYYDMPDDMYTSEYLTLHKPNTSAKSSPFFKEWGELEDKFVKLSQKANLAESRGDYKTAINSYLKMVTEECESTIPYERLMVIYRKLKWKEQQVDIIRKSIDFFTELRNRQAEYILYLGDKYGMRSKAQSYIDENKKVFYYGGAFELYNPQPKIAKWEERLKKLEK